MTKPANTLRQAHFICSSPNLEHCPPDLGNEVAFAGRSNAGKSSALNALTLQRKLARTSKTPGRTQQINFFEISEHQRLVDLPGYGYAKVPIKMKVAWQENMESYFEHRDSLRGIVLLMDVRHPFKPFDQLMIEWSKSYEMPLHILLTKSDKLKKGAAKSTLLNAQQVLKSADHISVQLFSSTKLDGLKTAQKLIMNWLNEDYDATDSPLESSPHELTNQSSDESGDDSDISNEH